MNFNTFNDDRIRLQFLTINYELIAAVGWQGYLEQGRGCVIIDATRAVNSFADSKLSPYHRWLMGTTPGFYLGEKSEAFQAVLGGQWVDAETQQRVAHYDPTQKVVTLTWLGGEEGDFIVQGISIPKLPPPVCYENLASRLSDFRM